MKLSLTMLALGAAVSAAFLPSQAFAQTPSSSTSATYVERKVGSDQEIIFPEEDSLVGDPLSTYGFGVMPAPRVLRAGLIRPRNNFLPELLKSVENL
ncbi:hypothetical protein AKJ09_08838 [Labilithrix luteola]|uniref:Uncharacterized protein n=1 Tax=Labilithrix luteola TaxID=1391654 RepID=A0A0K1Q9T6_9BACT|nr:hypothetical protein [Labilithrix luteola]AKV02175.1 hypothetical protein AKJ09_08838 [Labilithrix luteola]